MQKILAAFVALCLFLSCAYAEDIDLSGLSFDQLMALKQKVNAALFASDEWQEVTVPQGVWIGGEDIPVGRWTVRCGAGWGRVVYGESLEPNGRDVAYSDARGYFYLRTEDLDISSYAVESFLDVSDGMYIVIDNAPMVFSTYTGKPGLGFR